MSGLAQYNLTSSDGTTAQARVGQTVEIKGAKYQYFLSGGAHSAYDLVIINDDFTTSSGTTTNVGVRPVGLAIPQFAVASGEYFWAPVGPFGLYREDGKTNFKVNALTLCALDVKLYTTATAGAVDDTATKLIQGLILLETVGGATAAAKCVAFQKLVANCQD